MDYISFEGNVIIIEGNVIVIVGRVWQWMPNGEVIAREMRATDQPLLLFLEITSLST